MKFIITACRKTKRIQVLYPFSIKRNKRGSVKKINQTSLIMRSSTYEIATNNNYQISIRCVDASIKSKLTSGY